MARRRRNPWIVTSEIVLWVLFTLLLVPVGFAGWAVGHYTTLGGKPSSTRTVTVTGQAKTVTITTAAPGTTTSAPPATTTAAAAAGDAAAGKAVFASSGCATCHAFKPAGSTGAVGPNLDSAPTADAKKAGMSLDAFVRESIVQPDAYVPSGYAKGVMPSTFGSQLTKTQLDDLVAFIVSGAK
jgi:mono/diheme cytochrome c family protein